LPLLPLKMEFGAQESWCVCVWGVAAAVEAGYGRQGVRKQELQFQTTKKFNSETDSPLQSPGVLQTH
jgi:hypothetical protein